MVMVEHPTNITSGSSPSLSCTALLSAYIDIPVIVSTTWTGPDGTTFTPRSMTGAMMVNFTTYNSTANVCGARSGTYTCEATITSPSTSTLVQSEGMTTGSATITVCEYHIYIALIPIENRGTCYTACT